MRQCNLGPLWLTAGKYPAMFAGPAEIRALRSLSALLKKQVLSATYAVARISQGQHALGENICEER
jgi:hypothetical protein